MMAKGESLPEAMRPPCDAEGRSTGSGDLPTTTSAEIAAKSPTGELVGDSADDHNADGLRLAESGLPRAAAAAFRRATRIDPIFAAGWQNLGVALGQCGDCAGAIDALRTALLLNPDYFEAHMNLGGALLGRERATHAATAYRRAVEIRPRSADALNGLGLALTHQGRGAEAAIYLQQAIRLNPGFAGAFNNLGLALADAGRYDECYAAFDQALRLRPDYAEALANRGNALKEQRRLDEAIACHDLALIYKPGHSSTRWNRSLTLLLRGDLEEGWREYEARFDRPGAGHLLLPFDRPQWEGSPLSGKTVLVWPEQGLGDVVQFVRYGTLLKREGATCVIAWCPSPLLRILKSCPGLDQVILEGTPPPAYDVHVPLMSLPRLFGTRLDNVPTCVPYLYAPAHRVAFWRSQLARWDGLKVGIVWQGNPHHRWDRHRSVPLLAFSILADVPGVRLVSLQRGPGAEQLLGWTKPMLADPLAADMSR